MINNLNLSKNVQFFKLNKALTKKSVDEAFKDISTDKIGSYLFREIRKEFLSTSGSEVVYSVISFKIEEEPSFLTGTNVKESKYAYLLMVECDDALAILKKYIDSPEKYFSSFVEEYDYNKFCHFQGSKNPEYERVTMKNMSISDAVIRSRSLEAKNLNGIVPSNASSRSIPSNFRMRVGKESYTLTPSTSRVSLCVKKTGFEDLIDWVVETKEEIKATQNNSEFLNNFATPISLKDIIDNGHEVVAILLDLRDIEDKVINGSAVLKTTEGNQFSSEQYKKLFDHLRSPILVDKEILKTKGVKLAGKLTFSKNLITIRNKIFDGITVSEENTPEYTIGSYINTNKPFSAVFDSPNYSYYSRSCFEDKHLLNNIESILCIFDDSFNFNDVESEKEKPHPNNLTRFPDKSLFRKVEDNYCNVNNIIICDDMNDEWADHIEINATAVPPSISFIHSKFIDKDTQGASAFHEVVSQALKNIGRTQADTSLFKSKYDTKWSSNYEETAIKRINNYNWADIEAALNVINKNPNSIKKVVLATPFIKKSKLESELTKLSQGQKCKPHYIQLIWLINTFISSCKDFGVQAHILCKP